MSKNPTEYEVQVCRTSYAIRTIKVMAHSKEEAESLALEEAGDHIYSEHDATYEVVV